MYINYRMDAVSIESFKFFGLHVNNKLVFQFFIIFYFFCFLFFYCLLYCNWFSDQGKREKGF
jgi:hypothetical protein